MIMAFESNAIAQVTFYIFEATRKLWRRQHTKFQHMFLKGHCVVAEVRDQPTIIVAQTENDAISLPVVGKVHSRILSNLD